MLKALTLDYSLPLPHVLTQKPLCVVIPYRFILPVQICHIVNLYATILTHCAMINPTNMTILPMSYKPLSTLFTPTEKKFFKVLKNISGDSFHVFGKVRVSDILNPAARRYQKGGNYHFLLSQINQKHVDFVITDLDLVFLCAIELNDPSHLRKERRKRDQYLKDAFSSAGVPLVWVNAQSSYVDTELADHIASVVVGYSLIPGLVDSVSCD